MSVFLRFLTSKWIDIVLLCQLHFIFCWLNHFLMVLKHQWTFFTSEFCLSTHLSVVIPKSESIWTRRVAMPWCKRSEHIYDNNALYFSQRRLRVMLFIAMPVFKCWAKYQIFLCPGQKISNLNLSLKCKPLKHWLVLSVHHIYWIRQHSEGWISQLQILLVLLYSYFVYFADCISSNQAVLSSGIYLVWEPGTPTFPGSALFTLWALQ